MGLVPEMGFDKNDHNNNTKVVKIQVMIHFTFFFNQYNERTIELPINGDDGNCVVHYEGDYSDYVMKVNLVNGKREGKATIWNGEKPIVHLEYKNGELNGLMEVMDESGEVRLRGRLVNGKEKGIFCEYCCSIIVWMGYYRNGGRYSVLRKSLHMNGYYEERSVRDGRLLSIARYDAGMNEKNGYCIECKKGQLTVWIYENGMRKAITNDGRGSILKRGEPSEAAMEWMNNNEMKKEDVLHNGSELEEEHTIVSWKTLHWDTEVIEYDNTQSLIVYDIDNNYEYGILMGNGAFYEIKRSSYENRLICVDRNARVIEEYEDGVLLDNTNEIGVIDIDVNGTRWEGGMKDGKPMGYGVIYDNENRMEYEGYILNGKKTCRGIEYFTDINSENYTGCYFNGMRFGMGTICNRHGVVEYEGLWNNGEHYSGESDGHCIDNHTDSLIIRDNSFNELTSFYYPSIIPSLKRIVIGNNCFVSVRSFVLDGLDELKEVVIGTRCFTCVKEEEKCSDSQRTDGQFQIRNCPSLVSMRIGEFSFSDYHIFNAYSLPSLQDIVFHQFSFYSVHSFSIKGTT